MINGTRFRMDTDIARQTNLAARIARGQSDIATGKRLQVASDDPAASARIAVLRQQEIDTRSWTANADGAASVAARADSALGAIGQLLDRARELATSAASDTLNDADRAGIASELVGIATEIDGLGGETDAGGARVFPVGAALDVPVGRGLTLAATTTYANAFTVATTGGPVDMAVVLRNAAAMLNAGPAARATALANVTAASDHMAAVRGEQGTRAARIDSARDRLVTVQTSGTEERQALEATDVSGTVARIQGDQLALDAAQALFAKVNRRTLFDLLG
ncbi:flagellin [Sphingomonas sp.]|uniref:flagellin n=1 Tax=Sphingomonas sp. TaxID=28214 RepID=UPI0025CD152D|nr:flagellin [Sphingomonas sp.]